MNDAMPIQGLKARVSANVHWRCTVFDMVCAFFGTVRAEMKVVFAVADAWACEARRG